MQVFYTPQADAYLAVMSTLLAFSGLLGMVLARYYRDDSSKRLVRAAGRGVLVLALAMWLAIYSVPEVETGLYNYFVLVAVVFLFAAASIFQALLQTGRSRRLLVSLIVATLVIPAVFGYWCWLRLGDPGMAFPMAAICFAKCALFLSALWLCFFLPAITPAGRQMRAVWYLLTLYMLLVLLSPHPSLPGVAVPQPQWWNRLFLGIYQLRLVCAFAASVLTWRSYAVITDLGNKLRHLLAAMLLGLALLSVFVIAMDHQRYLSLMRSNLIAEAGNAAALMDPKLLKVIASIDTDAPALRSRFFRLTHRLEYQIGYRRVAAQVCALIAREDNPPRLIRDTDSVLLPDPGPALLQGWRTMLTQSLPVTTELDTPSLQNRVYALHPLHDEDGKLVGAAVLHVPAASLAAAIFRHRRPLVLALPLIVVGFILLLGRQRAVWDRAYAAGRDEALKLGALGHDLAGVCITRADNIVIEVNQRLCDIVESRRDLLVGRLIYEAFPSAPSDTGLTPEQILNGLRVHGRLHYETELLLPGGRTVHVMVLVRHLEGESFQGESVWECVDITPQKKLELQLRQQLESCQTGGVATTGLERH